jgi:hypothetical protein
MIGGFDVDHEVVALTYYFRGEVGKIDFPIGSLRSEDQIVEKVARQIRNLLVIVGPESVFVGSKQNGLSSLRERILSNCWISDPSRGDLIDIASKWNGAKTEIEFESSDASHSRSAPKRNSPLRRIGHGDRILTINLGQSEYKVAVLDAMNDTQDLGLHIKKVAGEVSTKQQIVDQLEGALLSVRSDLRDGTLLPTSAIISISSLSGDGRITATPNGLTKFLRSEEIVELEVAIRSCLRRVYGIDPTRVEFVNDGTLVAHAHAQLNAGQRALALRLGTTLCGGLTEPETLGELGWVVCNNSSGRIKCDEAAGLVGSQFRDFLTAQKFLAVDVMRRPKYLGEIIAALVDEVSIVTKLDTVWLCGSLIMGVNADALTSVFSDCVSRSNVDLPPIRISPLIQQRQVFAYGARELIRRSRDV